MASKSYAARQLYVAKDESGNLVANSKTVCTVHTGRNGDGIDEKARAPM